MAVSKGPVARASTGAGMRVKDGTGLRVLAWGVRVGETRGHGGKGGVRGLQDDGRRCGVAPWPVLVAAAAAAQLLHFSVLPCTAWGLRSVASNLLVPRRLAFIAERLRSSTPTHLVRWVLQMPAFMHPVTGGGLPCLRLLGSARLSPAIAVRHVRYRRAHEV